MPYGPAVNASPITSYSQILFRFWRTSEVVDHFRLQHVPHVPPVLGHNSAQIMRRNLKVIILPCMLIKAAMAAERIAWGLLDYCNLRQP